MKLKRLTLTNFRNYESAVVDFNQGVNVIFGNNAQGKTNLLEAIYFCSIGKSMRTNKEREVIKIGEELSKVKVEIEENKTKRQIEILFSKKNKKTVKINSMAIHKMGELIGELPCVFFSPDELKLIKESPEDRRRFMDIAISQFSKPYFYSLSKYEKILDQRNKLLKSSSNLENIKDSIFIWNEQLSSIGSKIITARKKFLSELEPFAYMAHSYLTNNDETLSLSYSGANGENEEDIKNIILKNLEKNLEKDFSLGYTTFGPHRDDIKILINDIDIKAFGSQGQQKTTALSMKLAELEIIKNNTGIMPLLLLDDVFSELDPKRRKRLLNFCSKTQTLITTTDIEESENCDKLIEVKNAQIINV